MFICVYLILFYNILLLYSFKFNLKKYIFYWRNISLVYIPYDTDDFPYIKKFEMLYKIHSSNQDCNHDCKQNCIHHNIKKFITTNYIPKIYPNISLKSIWTNEFSTELRDIMLNYKIIYKEVMDSVKYNYNKLFSPIGSHYGKDEIKKWDSCNIIKNRKVNKEIEKFFPNTINYINNLESFYGWLFISVLKPGAYIPKHRGRYNHKLTCHIGIDGLNGCKFIVDNKILKWEKEKYFVFNDFSYHEVIHQGHNDRIVLIFDLFHPELCSKEKKQIKLLEI